MGFIDTYGKQFNPDIPYMTRAEMAHFKRLRAGGSITFFRTGTCQHCAAEVLKGKRYCSERCYHIAENSNGQNGERGKVD